MQLFHAGLASQAEASVNWCPALGTVLANEEIINGLSERGNHPVVRHPLRQWTLKITKYADRLEQGLASLNWPEGTVATQRQWIGKSKGASIKFPVIQCDGGNNSIEVFTTRVDTLFGVTYLVLAPENPLVSLLTTNEQQAAVTRYCQEVAGKTDLERTSTGKEKGKTGVFTGSYAVHPITNRSLPIWVADYVLSGYGTGAVMAVPAHDERDFEFANKFSLPFLSVIAPSKNSSEPAEVEKTNDASSAFTQKGKLINSDRFSGLTSEDAVEAIVAELVKLGAGEMKTSYRLRDWLFSRQRYWGEPIPIYFPVELIDENGSPLLDQSGGTTNPKTGAPYRIRYDTPIAVDEKELPLRLPDLVDFQPGNDPQGCLSRAVDWRFFQRNGKWFARETNTMPQVMEYHCVYVSLIVGLTIESDEY